MNTELFIANRLFFDRSNRQFIIAEDNPDCAFWYCTWLAVMIVSVSVITGFKTEVRNKVIGFGSHIKIINFETQNSYEIPPISRNQPFLDNIADNIGV